MTFTDPPGRFFTEWDATLDPYCDPDRYDYPDPDSDGYPDPDGYHDDPDGDDDGPF